MGKFTMEETGKIIDTADVEQIKTEAIETKQTEITKEEEKPNEPNIKVLSPIFGFFIGDIVTPDSMFYRQFRIWAEYGSTITVDISKDAEIICEFVKNKSL